MVAVNDLVDAEMNALLFKHDSNYGAYPGAVDVARSKVFKESDPAALPWGDLGVDIVLESTGKFRDLGKSQAHLDAGAKSAIISVPANGADAGVTVPDAGEYAFACTLHPGIGWDTRGRGRVASIVWPTDQRDGRVVGTTRPSRYL